MGAKKNDIFQDTLALLILRSLAPGRRMHGYAITAHIPRVSGDLLAVEGSLYPALHRMEQEGWVRAEWGMTEKNPEARFYTITARAQTIDRRGKLDETYRRRSARHALRTSPICPYIANCGI